MLDHRFRTVISEKSHCLFTDFERPNLDSGATSSQAPDAPGQSVDGQVNPLDQDLGFAAAALNDEDNDIQDGDLQLSCIERPLC